ncbi:carbohydrate ABC transporter substrate-binding protein, CUT1 family [Sanguibacter gelidistatuariae]|uniref:Carbohydrate ABC transporter substrate-binding protein, CUT1 family n=1 Tax=Sanguibacter gelidistatuariae TaxID=1814289 RepID=A0A1G6XA10_9MICO|nr:ABC transporter substrate-binding protein [Sanguibacter gelidistatuariae]SDD74135.1 carbohydrate ABC transporter substrate-binding protein, CUT1 family [Sanguibacter gelidistatuariae]
MKKFAATAAIVTALGLTLAGCGDPSGADAGSSAPAEWAAQTADLSGVELTFWAAQSSVAVPEEVAATFEKATGAKVTIEVIPDSYEANVQTRVATGAKPDLAFWQPTPSMLTAINAKSNLLSLEGAPWIETMEPDLQDLTGILDDTRYATLIGSPSVIGVYYNKDVFAANGITELPQNFDDVLADAAVIDAAGVDPFFEMAGDGWGTQWFPQMLMADDAKAGFWDEVNAGTKTFSSPEMLDSITEYNDLITEGLFNADIKTATFNDQGTALLAGDAAMVVQNNVYLTQLQALATTDELNNKIGFFPVSRQGTVATSIPDQSNAIVAFNTGDAERESAARQFMSFWMGEGYPTFVASTNAVSIVTGVENSPEVPQLALDIHASQADIAPSMQAAAVANPDLWLNLVDMINGVKTPEDVAKATQSQFAELAKAAGVAGF